MASTVQEFEQAISPYVIEESGGGGNWFETGVNSAITIIDRITKSPEAIQESADRLNEQMIRAGQTITGGVDRVKSEGGQRARSNLTGNKINSLFLRASDWLQTGNNAIIAGAVLIFLIWIMRK